MENSHDNEEDEEEQQEGLMIREKNLESMIARL